MLQPIIKTGCVQTTQNIQCKIDTTPLMRLSSKRESPGTYQVEIQISAHRQCTMVEDRLV